MEQADFEKWIEAVHNIFEIFEGRYDAYPISRQWIDKWYEEGVFNISQNELERLSNLKNNFDYLAFGINDSKLKRKIDASFEDLIKNRLHKETCENIGLGIAPYLFTWNFQRFKVYFRQEKDFDLFSYFINLGEFIKNIKDKLKDFRKKKIYSDRIDENEVRQIFKEINNKLKSLGINQNEPVGVAKLLHILAPHYFPLIDNPIAKATGLKIRGQSLTVDDYIKWMKALKRWLENYDKGKIEKIEGQHNESILKLIDEGFYIMSSVNLGLRIKLMGLEVGD